ncbi:hypothetical protein BH10PAT1_BH10PAT1_2980 [soil metagenome]
MQKINKYKEELSQKFEKWVIKFNYKLIVFNIIIVFLFLLRSAGYFQPYFPISVNFIIIFSLVLSKILLNTNSKIIFLFVLVFWLFAEFLKLVKIDVWAERTGIYVYESLVFAVLLFLLESSKDKKNN